MAAGICSSFAGTCFFADVRNRLNLFMHSSRKMIVFFREKAGEKNPLICDIALIAQAIAQQNPPRVFRMFVHQVLQGLLIDFFQIFIAVDGKNPVLRGMRDGDISRGRKVILPCKRKDVRRKAAGDFYGRIRRAAVCDHNLRKVSRQMLAAFLDMGFFIFCNDTNGYRQHYGSSLNLLTASSKSPHFL